MTRTQAALGAVAATVALQHAVAPAATGDDPCADPRLRCPNLIMRTPSQLHLLAGGRLASTNAIVNVGDGPAEIRGRRIDRTHMTARQVVRARPGHDPVVLPSTGITIEFYDTRTRGSYWKYEHLARFELFGLHRDGTLGSRRRSGPKLDYCLRDLRRVKQLSTRTYFSGSPRTRQFPGCSTNPRQQTRTLGTSRGWTDAYPYRYPENWISVRGLSGCFAYVQRVDPLDQIRELREDDNAGAVVVRLPWRGPGRRGCPRLALPLPARDPG